MSTVLPSLDNSAPTGGPEAGPALRACAGSWERGGGGCWELLGLFRLYLTIIALAPVANLLLADFLAI